MDYEKAYRNALKKARELYNDEQTRVGMTPIHLTEIFPELKESGDEKIRKALIELFSSVGKKDWRGIPTENIIAWLEKQGERKTPQWMIDFLVSVKNRVQPPSKQEWTEEDKKCIRLSTDIIDSALRAGFCVQLDRDRCIDWLKSLKPQNKWKPSDEQMQALKEACDKHWKPDGLDPLYTLYKDLEKLKGE